MKRPAPLPRRAPDPVPARTAPLEQLHRCDACTGLFPLLVEGAGLCLRCDRLHFPGLVIA